MKAQGVRVVDVVLLGPFMMWASRDLRPPARELLWWAGVATIAYNAVNYVAIARQRGEP